MKKATSKIVIAIIMIIIIIYTIYNIIIRIDRRPENNFSKLEKEKVISTNIRVGVINFDTINPIVSENTNVQNISRLIFEPLIELTEDFRTKPCLSTEWTRLNKVTYLIKLREDVKWQDGRMFNCDDVIFTINTLKNMKESSIYYSNVKDIKQIKKIDEYTLQIITKEEILYFEYNLIFPIMSSRYSDKENQYFNEKNTQVIGTGKYYISDYDKDKIILKRNISWWENKNLKLDTITVNLYKNLSEALKDFEQLNVDLIMSSNIEIEKYIENLKCNTIYYPGRNYDYIAINCTNNVLKNIEVRQAIQSAINKEDIINRVYNGKYILSNFPLDFGSYLYTKNENKIEYNKEKSKEILEKQNWKYSNNIWKKGNEVIELELLVNKDDEAMVKVSEVIKEQLEEVGIKIKIIIEPKKEYNELIKNGKYDLVITGKNYGYSPSINSYFEEKNIAKYNNKDILNIIKNIETNAEENINRKYLSEIINIYNEEVPYISLYYNSNAIIYSQNLKGEIKPNSYNVFYNIENWYREYDKL